MKGVVKASLLAGLLGTVGCAHRAPPEDASVHLAWATPVQGDHRGASWAHQTFPGKSSTRFAYVRKDGRPAVAALADGSASMFRTPLQVDPAALGALSFSWFVPSLIEQADMTRRDFDDSPARIVLAFDGDRSRLSAKDAMLSELARTLTGEPMPYATLMYVWSNHADADHVIHNPRTGRIRKIVVESGAGNLGRWMEYRRDIRADFERAFGETPGPLVGVALMTDSDNTRSKVRAWYGPVRLLAPAPATSADTPQPLVGSTVSGSLAAGGSVPATPTMSSMPRAPAVLAKD